MVDLSGKRALVTGASRGLGARVAVELARHGAEVLLNYRSNTEDAEEIQRQIRSSGGSALTLPANLVDPTAIREMFQVIEREGGLDILVHSAILGSFKSVTELRANQWDLTMNTGARAFLLCAKEAGRLMEGNRGKMVAISSLGSQRVIPSYGAIGVTKAALEALIRYLAVELGPKGISVNGVAAGAIDSPTLHKHPKGKELLARAKLESPSGQLVTDSSIANVVLFLCSPFADSIQGQTIVADSGMSLVL